MEFERAIYRVYERCLEGLREDDPDTLSPKSCRFIESLVLSFAVFLLITLLYLHITFVNQKGCLPMLLKQIPNPINNSSEFIYYNSSNHLNHTLNYQSTALNLRKDQILQIDIDKRFLSTTTDSTTDDVIEENEEVSLVNGLNKHLYYDITNYLSNKLYYNSFRRLFNSTSTNQTHHKVNSNHPAHGHSYEFAYSVTVLSLNEEIRRTHDFEVFNVTLSGSECFGDVITMSLIPLGGIDTIVRNFIQSTYSNHDGVIITSAGDYMTWSKNENNAINSKYINKYITYRLMVLFVSFFSFFMLSTISALLVRILISSGVVLLFPLFWIVQRFTSHGISWRIISLSYPWIGIPIEVLRSRNQSIEPFIIAHICRIIVYYVLYEAAQLAFSVWFYNDSRPGQKELWIFAIMMLLEYYSMIYLRSRGSIVLFPRVILSTYIIYHIYIYLHPNGFHLLALLVMFMFMAWNMIFCVRKFELPAYSSGHVSIDAPRVLHNRVPWPMWSIAIAPDFTLFWPLDHQSMTIYGTAADNTSQANPISDNFNSSTNPPSSSDNGGDVELGSSSNITSSTNNTNSNSSETYTVSSPFLNSRRISRGYSQLPSSYNTIRSISSNSNLTHELSSDTIIDIDTIDTNENDDVDSYSNSLTTDASFIQLDYNADEHLISEYDLVNDDNDSVGDDEMKDISSNRMTMTNILAMNKNKSKYQSVDTNDKDLTIKNSIPIENRLI